MPRGFADYSNELQRCQSAINFIAFAEFYKDWRETESEGERAFDYGGVRAPMPLERQEAANGKGQAAIEACRQCAASLAQDSVLAIKNRRAWVPQRTTCSVALRGTPSPQ